VTTNRTISPYNLLQEQQIGHEHAEWRILVCCILLNRTHGRVVRPMMDELWQRWPGPMSMAHCMPDQLLAFVRPLGFGEQRTRNLRHMSDQYVELDRAVTVPGTFVDGGWVRGMSGCGQYAVDSINIFVYGKTDVVTSDTWLNKYLEWKREQRHQA